MNASVSRARRRMLRLFLVVLLAAPAALIPTASASAAVPPDFVGIVAEDVLGGDGGYRDSNLAQQSSIGVGLIRQTFDWSRIETSPGHYEFGFYDGYVAATASHGIRLLPILFNPPPFRSKHHSGGHGAYPPRRYGDLGRFGAALVRRYGPNGSFWAEHPSVPKTPIRSWQIWNEPNLPVYWRPRPNPAGYARMLRAARKSIKRADRGAEIVTAGMPESRLSPMPLTRYIARMYRAGAKRGFDTLAVNPYARGPRQLLSRFRAIRKVMNRHRDRGAKIWATEIGWSDVGPPSDFRVGPGGHASNVQRSLPLLASQRRRLGVRGVVYFNWKDAPPYPPNYKDFWGLHTGLLRVDGSPKPAFFAFRDAVARIR
jgi:hypothetical protein